MEDGDNKGREKVKLEGNGGLVNVYAGTLQPITKNVSTVRKECSSMVSWLFPQLESVPI